MSREPSKWLQEHEAMCIKILRWVFFGIVVSMFPFLFMLFRNWLSDLVAMELDYLPDLLLIIFAISAGGINLLWDSEKKLSTVAKAGGIAVLAVIMLCCAVTYASLFEQTIYNNKLLEAYDQLAASIESAPVDFIDNPEYEKNMKQLTTIKSIISETEPNPDKLKQLKSASIISLVAISIFGIAVEYFDDRKQQKLRAGLGHSGNPNPPASGNPNPPASGDPNPPASGDPNPPASGDPNPPASGSSADPDKKDGE